MIFLYL